MEMWTKEQVQEQFDREGIELLIPIILEDSSSEEEYSIPSTATLVRLLHCSY